MPIQPGQFDDLMPGLAVVEFYLEARKALTDLEEAKTKNEQARQELAVSGEKIRDAIYTVCLSKLDEHQKADPAALMKHLIAEYRAALSTNHLGKEDTLHHIACKAVLPFCKFDEDAFIKACEESTAGSKEAEKRYSTTRSQVSTKSKAWEEAIAKYKVGVFKEHSMVFHGLDNTPEQRAWDRASEFVRVWKHRASMHSEEITIECTSIRSYPDKGPAGDVKKRWASCYKLLGLSPARDASATYMARKFQ